MHESQSTFEMDQVFIKSLICLDCKSTLFQDQQSFYLNCTQCGSGYPIFDSHPILLSSNNILFPKQELYDALEKEIFIKKNSLTKYIPQISVNMAKNKLNLANSSSQI